MFQIRVREIIDESVELKLISNPTVQQTLVAVSGQFADIAKNPKLMRSSRRLTRFNYDRRNIPGLFSISYTKGYLR